MSRKPVVDRDVGPRLRVAGGRTGVSLVEETVTHAALERRALLHETRVLPVGRPVPPSHRPSRVRPLGRPSGLHVYSPDPPPSLFVVMSRVGSRVERLARPRACLALWGGHY